MDKLSDEELTELYKKFSRITLIKLLHKALETSRKYETLKKLVTDMVTEDGDSS